VIGEARVAGAHDGSMLLAVVEQRGRTALLRVGCGVRAPLRTIARSRRGIGLGQVRPRALVWSEGRRVHVGRGGC
jgi:hypothetical protein